MLTKRSLSRLGLMLIVSLLAVMVSGIAAAQDDAIPLTYNEPVPGEMTNEAIEFTYTFTGKASDVVILRASQLTALSDFDDPVLTLLGPDGQPIADTTGSFSIGFAILALRLPEDGEYTAVLTREDGAEGDTVGEFTMEAILAAYLEPETPVDGTLDSDGREQYYAVDAASDFTLALTVTRQGLPLAMSVNQFDERTRGLASLASVGGSELTEAEIGVFDAETLYVISIDEPLFSFSFGAAASDYVIELLPVE